METREQPSETGRTGRGRCIKESSPASAWPEWLEMLANWLFSLLSRA